jgi:nicotinamide-nucleotide amidase
MAEGAVDRAPVDLAISAIGVAGPGGGSAKPVGLVIFGLARRNGPSRTERRVFDGDRSAVRQAAVHTALGLLAAEARAD